MERGTTKGVRISNYQLFLKERVGKETIVLFSKESTPLSLTMSNNLVLKVHPTHSLFHLKNESAPSLRSQIQRSDRKMYLVESSICMSTQLYNQPDVDFQSDTSLSFELFLLIGSLKLNRLSSRVVYCELGRVPATPDILPLN